jgi:hypothetical protein
MNKNFIIIGLILLTVGLFIFGFNEHVNFKKERKALNAKIDMYKSIDDSLVKVEEEKQKQYQILEQGFKRDSLVLDSLKDEYVDAKHDARQSEKQAEFYKGRYTEVKTKISYLETHTINISNDSLLISLSKKIN